ncbi:MAG: phosphatase PAP2 family protein [Acholeplasmataceae bacterium]|jgi:undecaprenyl-diphosphatase|nr:phosphatase PAP2 family protein [Acholeplasmataceae bacterium]
MALNLMTWIQNLEFDLIRSIQYLRNPILDETMYFITQLGDQLFFIAVAVIIYWTIDKRFAHKFVFAFMMSAVINTGLKYIFKRIRPFYYMGIESEPKWRTTGYSFPSGHAQASGVLGYTGLYASKKTKQKWLSYVAWFIMIFVPLSRIYLAQHFLTDVIVGLVLAYGLAHISFLLVDKMKDDEHIYTLMLAPLFIIALFFYPNHDLAIAAGGFVGFALGYYLEKRYIKFEVKAAWWIQIVKVVFGLAIAFGLKEGLKLIFLDHVAFDFIRYFLIGVWASVGAPIVFKYGTGYFAKNV